jgi:anion-transporting  ArsA/GET3 family ATPase
MSLDAVTRDARVVITLGPGGVGKTTTAAALALRAARDGRRALVCTIDPARRLASALGLGGLGDDPAPVPPEQFVAEGLPPTDRLMAMMLDAGPALDRLLLSEATDADAAAALRVNPLYQAMVHDLPGMHEYAAVSRLHELHTSGDHDLVVLDTPPTSHALDFLDAPRRLARALDSPALTWLVKPYLKAGSFSLRVLGGARGYVLRRLAQIVGTTLLERIAAFLVHFSHVLDGARARTEAVSALLASPAVRFVLVTSPTAASVQETLALHGELAHRGLAVHGLVMNRMHHRAPAALDRPEAVAEALASHPALRALPPGEQLRLLHEITPIHGRYQHLARADARQLELLLARCRGLLAHACVPLLEEDVHSLAAVSRVSSYL